MAERIDGDTCHKKIGNVEDGSELDTKPENVDDRPDDGSESVITPDIEINPSFLPNDVVLVVQDRRLHVNEHLLVSASPVFAAWLKKEWQNDKCQDNTKKELMFPGKSYEDMMTFLQCLLPIFPDKVTDETLDILLPLADEYQAEALLSECAEVIRQRVESVSNTDTYIPPSRIIIYVLWVDQFKLHKVQEYVVRLASYLKSEELEAVPDYANVSQILQLEIAKARAELLGGLFVFNVTEAENKTHQFKIPRSSHYMAEWKQLLAQIVERAVTESTSSTWREERYDSLEPPINSGIAAMFTCLSVGDRFGFSDIYEKCIDMLSPRLSKKRFIKLWSMHYSTDSCKEQLDCMDRHMLQICKRKW